MQVLNKEIYGKLRGKSTPSGFTVDDVIQTGVDNPGKDVNKPTRSSMLNLKDHDNKSVHNLHIQANNVI